MKLVESYCSLVRDSCGVKANYRLNKLATKVDQAAVMALTGFNYVLMELYKYIKNIVYIIIHL